MIRRGVKFKRVCRLVIGKASKGGMPTGGISVDERFKLTFEVTKTAYKTPNTATISVYNLPEDVIARVQDTFDEVVLLAGYDRDPLLIFRGSIKFRYVYRDKNDMILTIDAADGDKEYRKTMVNFTMRAQSTESQAIDQILAAMPTVKKGHIAGKRLSRQRGRGKVYSGPAHQVLSQIAGDNEALWSFQDGKLVMVPIDSTMPTEAITVDSSTGLLGVPEKNDKGVAITMMMEPRANPNGKLWLKNREVKEAKFKLAALQIDHSKKKAAPVRTSPDGVYKMFVVTHKGDTRGTDWKTETKCVDLDARIPTSKTEQVNPMAEGPDDKW